MGAVICGGLALFFGLVSYGQLRARSTGRANAFVPRIGNRRPGSVAAGFAFAWLSSIFAAGAVGFFVGV